ncbi:hypothetical protein [Zhihengliuella halotolerans]|uniref:hypothetical protein n=1 Tax=Zhihengliuella halotolerans TaxID=370736 RepID=UPI000C80B99C|nr:hypothetical protein [Zhihengliuella halotolerans]
MTFPEFIMTALGIDNLEPATIIGALIRSTIWAIGFYTVFIWVGRGIAATWRATKGVRDRMTARKFDALGQLPEAVLAMAAHAATASHTIQRCVDREERLARIHALYGDDVDDALEALEHLGMAGMKPWQLTFMAQSFMRGDNNQKGPTL